jgi:hypothetical protein
MSKRFTITESEKKEIRRKYGMVMEQETNNSETIRTDLLKIVGYGRGVDYQKICDYCSKVSVPNSNNAKVAALEFNKAITGVENPFNNMLSVNKESGAFKAGQAITKNIKTPEELCDFVKNYEKYSLSGESFCDAVSGELNLKVDSSGNLTMMVGKPMYKVLNLK